MTREIQIDEGNVSGRAFQTFIQRRAADRLEPPERTFVYLDCGAWVGSGQSHAGGPSYAAMRTFGVVFGRWVVLCEFLVDGVPETPRPGTVSSSDAQAFDRLEIVGAAPINELLGVLNQRLPSTPQGRNHRVRIIDARYCTTALPIEQEPAQNRKIYVLFPDMHLPTVTGLPDSYPQALNSLTTRYHADGRPVGRVGYLDHDRRDGGAVDADGTLPSPADSVMGGGRYLGDGAVAWFEAYLRSDIFQEAHADLHEIARRLAAFASGASRLPLHVVQLGDMFELWIGMECFFASGSTVTPTAVRDRAGATITTAQFVDHWVPRILGQVSGVTSGGARSVAIGAAVNALAAVPGSKTWLYGNHDCYLGLNTTSYVPSRSRELTAEMGIHAEHGHRMDAFNRDGNASGVTRLQPILNYQSRQTVDVMAGLVGNNIGGHAITNLVFSHPWLRAFDPDRRNVFIGGAAELWLQRYDRNPFGIFVMAHTHAPLIDDIRITPAPRARVDPGVAGVPLPPVPARPWSHETDTSDRAYHWGTQSGEYEPGGPQQGGTR